MHNVVICKRIKNSSKRYTVRGRMAKVSETGSSSVMIGVWWCPCNTCFPWVKVGVPMWKSNTSLVLRCSDAQYTKIAIFCSKRIEVRASLLPAKKWSHVIINFKPQKIFQIYRLRKYFRSFFLANLTWIWFSWKIHSMLFDFHSIIQNGKARSQS